MKYLIDETGKRQRLVAVLEDPRKIYETRVSLDAHYIGITMQEFRGIAIRINMGSTFLEEYMAILPFPSRNEATQQLVNIFRVIARDYDYNYYRLFVFTGSKFLWHIPYYEHFDYKHSEEDNRVSFGAKLYYVQWHFGIFHRNEFYKHQILYQSTKINTPDPVQRAFKNSGTFDVRPHMAAGMSRARMPDFT